MYFWIYLRICDCVQILSEQYKYPTFLKIRFFYTQKPTHNISLKNTEIRFGKRRLQALKYSN